MTSAKRHSDRCLFAEFISSYHQLTAINPMTIPFLGTGVKLGQTRL